MDTTIKGIVRNGIVEASEPLALYEGSEVLITVTAPAKLKGEGKQIYFGIFKHWGDFTEEDFKVAEWDEDKFLREFEE